MELADGRSARGVGAGECRGDVGGDLRGLGRFDPEAEIRKEVQRGTSPLGGPHAAATIMIGAAVQGTEGRCGLGDSRSVISRDAILRQSLVTVHCGPARRSGRERSAHAVHGRHRSNAGKRQRPERRDEHDHHQKFGSPEFGSATMHGDFAFRTHVRGTSLTHNRPLPICSSATFFRP